MGFDTETLDGKAKLIADSLGNFVLDPDFDSALSFITKKPLRGKHLCWFNLKYDFQAILRLCEDERLVERILAEERVEYKEYGIYYVKDRFLVINKSKRTFFHVDVARFFHQSLDTVAKTSLGKHKLEGTDRELIGTQEWYWVEYEADIIQYCVQDAVLTAEILEMLQNTLIEAEIIPPRRYISPASVSKGHFVHKCSTNGFYDVPRSVQEIFFSAYCGGRFEVKTRGWFENLWSADLKSAYWSAIRDIPVLTLGKWTRTSEFIPNHPISVYLVSHLQTGAENGWTDLPIRTRSGKIFYPAGLIKKWVCGPEMEHIHESVLKIFDGWVWEPVGRVRYAYRDEIDRLWSVKENPDVPKPVRYSAKLAGNAYYGIKIEIISKNGENVCGRYFNPVEAAYITSKTRAELLAILHEFGEKIVAVHTDSVIATEPLPFIRNEPTIGEWAYEDSGEGVVIGCGQYSFGNKCGHRCVSFKSGDDFSEFGNRQDWKGILERSVNSPFVAVKTKRVISGRQALIQGLPVSAMNRFIDYIQVINLKGDSKRFWTEEPTCGRDLLSNQYYSVPKTGSYAVELGYVDLLELG